MTSTPWQRLAMIALAAVACDDPNIPQSTQAFVRGTVRTSAGFPADSATVVVEVTRAADSSRVGSEPTVTDAQGRYAVLLAVFGTPFDALMTISASWELGGSRQNGLVESIPIHFGFPQDGIDTVRVNIDLSAVF